MQPHHEIHKLKSQTRLLKYAALSAAIYHVEWASPYDRPCGPGKPGQPYQDSAALMDLYSHVTGKQPRPEGRSFILNRRT